MAEQVRGANEAAWKDMVTASQKAFAELQRGWAEPCRASSDRDEDLVGFGGHVQPVDNRHAWLRRSLEGTMPMKIKAAVLNKMGAEAPYAKSKPLTHRGARARRSRSWRSAGEDRRGGSVPFRSFSDRRQPAAADADGARPRGRRHRGEARARRRRSQGRRSCGDGVRAELRALPALCGRPSCAVRTRRGRQRSRHAALRPAAAASRGQPMFTIISAVSAFAEYATVSRRSLVKIDKELPLEEAALFGCAVLTGVGAVINTAKVPAGSSVAVIGLGGVGLSALLGASALSARVASLQSTSPTISSGSRASSVQRIRSTRAVPVRSKRSRPPTGGGVEFAFEMAGSVRAMDLAYKITRRGGTTVTAGSAAARPHLRAASGQPRRRGADGQGQLHRHMRADPRSAALHRAVSTRQASGGPADERPSEARRDQSRVRSAARR